MKGIGKVENNLTHMLMSKDTSARTATCTCHLCESCKLHETDSAALQFSQLQVSPFLSTGDAQGCFCIAKGILTKIFPLLEKTILFLFEFMEKQQ